MLSTVATPHLLALALVAGAAFTDARTGHIPNQLTLPPLVIAPVYYLFWWGATSAALSVLAAVLCAIVPYLMFRKDAAGGGDVKLLAAVGAVGGASFGIETQIFGFAVAAFFSILLLAYRGRLLITLVNAMRLAISPFLPRRMRKVPRSEAMSTIRMGVPFFVGAMIAIWVRSGGMG